MAAAGFPWAFVIDGVESNWKQCRFSDDNAGVDASSRILPDGSENTGFTDRDYDLSKFTFTLTEPAQKSADVRGDITDQLFDGVAAGYRNESDTWYVSYDGVVLFFGTGVYVSNVSGSGSIPGEGSLSVTIEAIGAYDRS